MKLIHGDSALTTYMVLSIVSMYLLVLFALAFLICVNIWRRRVGRVDLLYVGGFAYLIISILWDTLFKIMSISVIVFMILMIVLTYFSSLKSRCRNKVETYNISLRIDGSYQ